MADGDHGDLSIAKLIESASSHTNGGGGGDNSGRRDPFSKVGDVAMNDRGKRKVQRLIKQNSKDGSIDVGYVIKTSRRWKNSRKPRSGYRGLPKKGGAGGKGVWGKLGSESEGIGTVDRKDPNYDSDATEDGEVELKSAMPELSDEELKKNVEMIVLEYYEHGDTNEAVLSFDELNCGVRRHMIVSHMIEIALEHRPSHRELTSILLCDLTSTLMKPKDIFQAFHNLLSNLPDLILDSPDAPTTLGNFMARAAADACISPKVVVGLKEKVDNPQAKEAIGRATTLLSVAQGLYRLDNVWGIGGSQRPVKTLIKQMTLLLEEYISSGDVKEAARCLQELEVPHFHHELVYEAIIMTMEKMNPDVELAICNLLKYLSDAVIITTDMMERGFLRVYEDMPDIILDMPLAYTSLDRFVEHCGKAQVITAELAKNMPMRGRKRCVSEGGDGGRCKEF